MGGLGGLGGAPEHNAKRRRLERDNSRSGPGSGTDDEALTVDKMAAMIATPEDATENSLHNFNASRLEGSRGPGASSPSPGPALPPVKMEPGHDGPLGGHGKKEMEAGAVPRATGSEVPGGRSAAGEGGDSKEGVVVVPEGLQTSGAYCAREASLKMEEDAGRLQFVCHYNDGVEQHMIWLVGLKNIFSRQLPNMPKEYIVRLVLDRSHKSMMIIKNNHVVGGITYRPYLQQHFGEIAFCAITASEQVKGYGTRLMNHLKQYSRDVDGLTHFLTYADNNAVGYFSKQGFTKEITLEEERWTGYIKDYDGGTLMECVIDPLLPYTDLPAVVKRQRQTIDEKIRQLSNCHIVHPGLELHKNEVGVPRRPIRIEDIPGMKASGWSPEQSSTARLRLSAPGGGGGDAPPSRPQLHALMRSLHKAIWEHQDAWPFKEPVNPKEVADYYDVIKDPIDLKSMLKRLDSEAYYVHLEMFVADMRRMFANAMKYNSPETIYYKAAKRLEGLFMNKLKAAVVLPRASAQGS